MSPSSSVPSTAAHTRASAAEALLRSILVVSRRHVSMTACACGRLVNQCSFRHSSRKRPLNDSMYAFCVGLPGSISRSVTPLVCAQVSIARPQNSAPLSVRRTCGRPRVRARASSTRVSGRPPSAHAGTTATASVVASSTIVRHFNTRLSAVRSKTKSADHTAFGACGRTSGYRAASGTFLRRRRRTCRRASA